MATSRSPGRELVDAAILEDHLAAVGGFEPGDDPQQGGLARPRRTQESDEFARRDVEIDRLQHLRFP